MKKSQIEIQFNWIFILIAGGLILTFFVFIIKGHGKTAEQTFSIETLTKLDAIITGQEATEGKEDMIDVSKELVLEFDCVGYSIGGVAPKPTTSSVVFSPSSTKGTLLTWTKSWDAPFRVMNFIYITSSNIKYYIIAEDITEGGLANRIYEELPGNLDKALVKYPDDYDDEIEHHNNYHVRLVYVDISEEFSFPADLEKLKNDEASALFVDSNNQEVEFLRKEGNTFVPETIGFSYFGDVFLYGAVYSGNAELYECNLEKAKKRFSHVAEIYTLRTDALVGNSPLGCDVFYISDYFAGLNERLEDDDGAGFYSAIQSLENQNEATIIKSCPSLY